MAFEWNPHKRDANRLKHVIDFTDVVGDLEDPYALTRPDSNPTEERFVTLGRDFLDRVIVVSWTWRGDDIRLISARRATAQEHRQYTEDVNA